MLLFVVPLTVLTLVVLVVRSGADTAGRSADGASRRCGHGVMTQPMSIALILIAGLALLVVGAEALVRGAALAAAFRISPLVIGLTVVAFGTSAPEMAVSVQSALAGQADIALGNVIGSNIFNVLLILGLSALIVPLVVQQKLVRLDVPIMIGVSVLVFVLGLDGRIGRLEGALLFLGLAAFTVFQIRQGRRETEEVGRVRPGIRRRPGQERRPWALNVGLLVGGLACWSLGSQLAGGRRLVDCPLAGRQRTDHRPDHRRGRHLAARGGHVGHGRDPRRARHRRRQRGGQQRLQSSWACWG